MWRDMSDKKRSKEKRREEKKRKEKGNGMRRDKTRGKGHLKQLLDKQTAGNNASTSGKLL